jgi:hypothetical protein
MSTKIPKSRTSFIGHPGDEISTNFSSVSFSTATLFSPIVQRGSGLPPSIF